MRIEIEDWIAQRLKKYVEQEKRFETVEEYVNDVLGQIVERLGNAAEVKERGDEAKVKERLRSLGYLD